MSLEELKEYLGIVTDMEKNIFLQKRMRSEIEQIIKNLKIPTEFDDPLEPIVPTVPSRPLSNDEAALPYIIIVSVVSFFCIKVFPYPIILFVGGMLFVCGIFGIFISLVNLFMFYMSHEMDEYQVKKREYPLREKEYQKKLKEYQNLIKENQIRREHDKITRELKSIFLQKEKARIEQGLAISEEHIRTIYEKNVIFPKYRNLAMVCSLYEYICAGRCSTLEGHEGAYNILETEIRLDRIIVQMDQVIHNLQKIQQNQYMLYSTVQESTQRLEQILSVTDSMASKLNGVYKNSIQLNSQIAELQETSELTTYYTERTQKELEYINRMNYLSGRNDDVFFNHPPV